MQSFQLPPISKDWTLFLDRDGVLNHEKNQDYIRNRTEFIFYEGVPEAIAAFSTLFGRIVIVTNQRGVGKGWMTGEDLTDIHLFMTTELEKAGGRIDGIFYCTSLDNDHPNRKPNPGMAFEARAQFPEIDFSRSIMVGNNLSDMGFGRNAGMYTAYLRTTKPNQPLPHPDIDLVFDHLGEMARFLVGRNV